MAGRTMLDKVWTHHAVATGPGGRALLYVDRHLVHEGSFHAFEMLHDAEIGAFEARHVAEWPWAVPGRLAADPPGSKARASE